MSIKKEDEIENLVETKLVNTKPEEKYEEDKKSEESLLQNESPDGKNSRVTKSKASNDFDFQSPLSSQGTDYKEKLRKSLETGSKRLSKDVPEEASESSDNHILSPDDSHDSFIKPHDYQLSPLHEKYANIEELKSSTLKKQQEMLAEINRMREQEFDLVNQLSNNLALSEGGEDDHKNVIEEDLIIDIDRDNDQDPTTVQTED